MCATISDPVIVTKPSKTMPPHDNHYCLIIAHGHLGTVPGSIFTAAFLGVASAKSNERLDWREFLQEVRRETQDNLESLRRQGGGQIPLGGGQFSGQRTQTVWALQDGQVLIPFRR